MDKREHEKSKKMALLIFFSDEENTSILCFFRENNYEESLPFHLTRVVTTDKRLGDSVATQRRRMISPKGPGLADKAMKAL